MTETNETLNSLLGPSGAEVGCDECFHRLGEYGEAELAARDLEQAFPGFRAHLAGCPACREDHENLRALVLADDA